MSKSTAKADESRPPEFAGSKTVSAAAEAFGWEAPTGLQAAAHRALAAEKDVVIVAGPARGRTGAWLLPLVDAVKPGEALSGMVLVPDAARARALAEALAAAREGLVALSVDAESDLAKTVRRLERGVDIAVGTVSRVRELHSRGALDLGLASFVVVDRADESLDADGLSDMEWVLGHGKEGRRTVLVSGVIAAPHRRLIKKHLKDSVEVGADDLPAAPVGVGVAWARGRALFEAAGAWVTASAGLPILVWTRSRSRAVGLSAWLRGAGFRTEVLHSGMAARAKTSTAARFRRGDIDVLVATDAGAREIDLGTPAHSVSVGLPAEPADFARRNIGTGDESGLEFILEESERAAFEALTKAWDLETRSLGLPAMARPVAPGAAVSGRAGAAAANPTAPARKAPGESTVRLYIGGGAILGATARDILRELTRRGGVDERAIGFVEVLGRASFVDVSTQAAQQVLDRVRFLELCGEQVPISVARPRREKTDAPRGPSRGRDGGGRPPRGEYGDRDRPPRGRGGPPQRGFSDGPPQRGFSDGPPRDTRDERGPSDGQAPPRRGFRDGPPRGPGRGPGRGGSGQD
ncbi:MAG: DEAD/DEAH box helicase [Myxococcota bacterium]